MGEKLITITSIAIAVVCLLIVFNIVGITNTLDHSTTGFAVSDTQEDEEEIQETPEEVNSREEAELYSEQAYGFFYFIVIILIVVIAGIGLTFLIPKMKKYT